MLVSRALNKLLPEFPGLTVEEIDVVAHPATAWKNGVRMIPTLKAEGKTLSGVMLTTEQIRKFLLEKIT